jgi:hypothetical protein
MVVFGQNMDEQFIIAHRSQHRPVISPTGIYLISKSLPFVAFLLLNSLSAPPLLLTFTTVFLSLLNFFVMKNISGYQILGLKWSINLPGRSLAVLSRPEPFVPLLNQSNLFWLGFVFSIAAWTVCFFVNLFGPFPRKAGISGSSCLLEAVNFVCFAKSHRESKHRTEAAVLNSLKDGVHFDLVPENEEEKAEDEVPPRDDSPAATSVDLPPPLAAAEVPEDKIY